GLLQRGGDRHDPAPRRHLTVLTDLDDDGGVADLLFGEVGDAGQWASRVDGASGAASDCGCHRVPGQSAEERDGDPTSAQGAHQHNCSDYTDRPPGEPPGPRATRACGRRHARSQSTPSTSHRLPSSRKVSSSAPLSRGTDTFAKPSVRSTVAAPAVWRVAGTPAGSTPESVATRPGVAWWARPACQSVGLRSRRSHAVTNASAVA